MNTTESVKQNKITKTVIYLLALAAAFLATSFSRAGDRVARATVGNVVHVKQITGAAEYAYDSTGWRPLVAGKILHAGASIRTSNSASVVLAMEEQGSLVRVGPLRRLELASAAPEHESNVTIVPLQARIKNVSASATKVATK